MEGREGGREGGRERGREREIYRGESGGEIIPIHSFNHRVIQKTHRCHVRPTITFRHTYKITQVVTIVSFTDK